MLWIPAFAGLTKYLHFQGHFPTGRHFFSTLLASTKVIEGIHAGWQDALEKKGIMGMDALHVASEEQARADYFVSCDDVLIKRLGVLEDLGVRVS